MKAFYKKRLWVAVILAVLAALLPLCFFHTGNAYASSHSDGNSDAYSYVFNTFDVTYDIDESGYMCVTEKIGVTYTGAKSYAITRTLITEDSDRILNLSVYEFTDGEYEEADYSIDSESGDVVVEIGDEDSKTNESHIYTLYYEYYSTDQTENEVCIYPLNGIEAEIEVAAFRFNLPYTPDGSVEITLDGEDVKYSIAGNNVTISLTDIESGAELKMYASFNAGTISSYTNINGYFVLIVLGVIAIALIVVKLVFFNKHRLKKEMRRELPPGYDPLLVGKLIDNTVSDSDVASLIFHWAAKGYIKINLKDANKPVLTKCSNLPAIAPNYQQILFYNLFRRTNVVYIDELDEDFYKTTESVKKAVDEKAGGSYSSTSMGLSVLFAVLAAFVMGFAPTFFAMVSISPKYVYITGLIFAIPPLIVYAFCETLMYNRYKMKPKIFAGYLAGIIVICVACTALYAWLVPSNLIELVPKILICVFGYAVTIASTALITRTEKYSEQLGAILGFRKFIKTAQHAELRETATKHPQLFYEIYPYAQVLNLEKEWMDKFYSMNVKAPDWGIGTDATGKVSIDIAIAMKTARIRIAVAISTSPDATKHKKIK
ncbi:MAG: DUF2207 domain-containing protein [Clostridia bacterium]|nr:DUF2207 domain-containing protein [Clostridia bacterium]